MMNSLCYRSFTRLIIIILTFGLTCLNLVSCTQGSVVITTEPITVVPKIITVEVPVTTTPLPSPTPLSPPRTLAYSGNWLLASPMTISRGFHTATVLDDGRVLIVGGYTSLDTDTARVEIFDPATNTFTQTGSLHLPRHGHSATLLMDGRVLVIGGYALPQGWLSDAEIYDPETEQWATTQPLFPHGVCHSATLLADGRVLVMAGSIRSGHPGSDDRVEIFNPNTNRWQKAAYHEHTEACQTATRLEDGRVLIAGGLADPTIYDPATNTWKSAGKLNTPRSQAQAVLLQSGRVLLIGGLSFDGEPTNSVEIYDVDSNTWQETAPLDQARYNHTATLLPDGRVLVLGGWGTYNGYESSLLDTAEIYDEKTAIWSTAAPLNTGRANHTATLLPEGQILVTGGQKSYGEFLNSVEILGE